MGSRYSFGGGERADAIGSWSALAFDFRSAVLPIQAFLASGIDALAPTEQRGGRTEVSRG